MSGQEAALVFFIFGGSFWVLRPLAERVDFAERLLAKPREGERLAPPGR